VHRGRGDAATWMISRRACRRSADKARCMSLGTAFTCGDWPAAGDFRNPKPREPLSCVHEAVTEWPGVLADTPASSDRTWLVLSPPTLTRPCSAVRRPGLREARHWTRPCLPCLPCPSQPLSWHYVCSSDRPSMHAIALCLTIDIPLPSGATVPALGRRCQYQIH
jgi:hypothetical protein